MFFWQQRYWSSVMAAEHGKAYTFIERRSEKNTFKRQAWAWIDNPGTISISILNLGGFQGQQWKICVYRNLYAWVNVCREIKAEVMSREELQHELYYLVLRSCWKIKPCWRKSGNFALLGIRFSYPKFNDLKRHLIHTCLSVPPVTRKKR